MKDLTGQISLCLQHAHCAHERAQYSPSSGPAFGGTPFSPAARWRRARRGVHGEWWRFRALALAAWVLSFFVGFARPAQAAPANDNCSSAVIIPGAGPFPHTTALIDISTATLAGDPPV